MKAYDRHMVNASNKRHVWTESEILSVRMCIHRSGIEKAYPLIMELNEGGFRITPEQTTKGIEYLRSKLWKDNGEHRNTEFSRCFGIRERAIIQGFKKFTFEGVRYEQRGSSFQTTPIYRVHSNAGYFDYTMGHWGLPEIL